MVDQSKSGANGGGNEEADGEGAVVRFPQSRVRPAGSGTPFTQLGSSRLAQRLGTPDRQGSGHWCSHCRGIWYGYLLEVECPVCGNRHG